MRLLNAAILVLASAAAAKPSKRSWSTHDYYVVEYDARSGATLSEVADALGVEVVERAGELKDHWLVRAPKTSGADAVLAARDSLHAWNARDSIGPHHTKRAALAIKYVEKQVLRQRVKRQGVPPEAPPQPDSPTHPVAPTTPDIPTRPVRPDVPAPSPTATGTSSHDVALRLSMQDPEFGKQWHLVNDEDPSHSMNVSGIWEMGITGRGVISALIDDGLDYTSDDLSANFYALGSYDYNDHVDLPTPVLPEDTHGTRCAGQIAAAKNDVCGVGTAYDSKIAGIRILSGPISDIDEAASLTYAYQNTSIYSCSWGPTDDGRTMEAPGYLVEKAFVEGINNGRGGKGSIYVFASGNGAWSGDQCNFDGFTNSIYSITVAALDHKNLHPSYSEACAANMVVAYSSGSGKSISTTDVARDGSGSKCTSGHGGTSAAAPNAVGVFALALSVRPDLTWRDMQHLAVRTAVQIQPDDPDWERTAQGRPFSYKYGFGLLDGYRYVTAAKDWKNVKPQAWLDVPYVQLNNGTMDLDHKMSGGEPVTKAGVTSSVTVSKEMMSGANLESLEHITVRVWIEHSKRGDVEVEIVSPKGIKSILAAPRHSDSAKTGFPGWRFSTIKHWDEDPLGTWTIRVNDQGEDGSSGAFLGWTMSLWGSTIEPSTAKQWSVPKLATVFPPLHPDEAENHPVASASLADAATSTKTYTNPTVVLGDNHTHAEGEAHRPAFSSAVSSSTSSATARPSSEGDWVSDTTAFVSDQKYLLGVVALLLVLVLIGGIVLQRKLAARRRRAQYASVAAEENVPLRSLDTRLRSAVSAPRDASAPEHIEDEDDADEETKLHGSERGPGYHSGFLDDEEMSPAAQTGPPSFYKDEPETDAHASDAR